MIISNIPDFRKQCLLGKYPNGTKHQISNTWIKIKHIEKLVPPKQLQDFKKWNGTALTRVQGGIVYLE
jgi:hypothetical protein